MDFKESILIAFLFLFALLLFPFSAASSDLDWKAVQECWYKDNISTCKDSSCSKKKLANFKKCVQQVTKKAKLKKGSSYKDVNKSIENVMNVVQQSFNDCYKKARSYEQGAVKGAKELTKDQKKEIAKKTEEIRNECFDGINKMVPKALEAQIKQHFQ